MNKTIRVIFFQDGGGWVAQALEHDICVQAEKSDELFGRFEVAFDLYHESEGGLAKLPPAPKHFHDLWDKQSGVFTPKNAPREDFTFAMAA
jgi:hypothetical protein